jgi:hypothetical protein
MTGVYFVRRCIWTPDARTLLLFILFSHSSS